MTSKHLGPVWRVDYGIPGQYPDGVKGLKTARAKAHAMLGAVLGGIAPASVKHIKIQQRVGADTWITRETVWKGNR